MLGGGCQGWFSHPWSSMWQSHCFSVRGRHLCMFMKDFLGMLKIVLVNSAQSMGGGVKGVEPSQSQLITPPPPDSRVMQSGFTLYHMGHRSLKSLNLNIASHTYIINIHTLTVLLSYLPALLLKAKLGFFQPQLHHQSTAYIYCMHSYAC